MNRRLRITVWMLVILAVLSACQATQPQQKVQEEAEMELQVESSAFLAGEAIPKRHTCDGDDVSPALSWSEPPAGAESLALILDDPDAPAGTWVHWVLFDIPATSRSLPEGVSPAPTVEGTGVHGNNSWRRVGYGGPCPPQGPAHRYVFRLYALDTTLGLKPGATRQDVDKAMKGHILAQGELMGQYGR